MPKEMKYTLLALLLMILLGGGAAMAQNFDPTTPPEPQVLYKISTSSSLAGSGVNTSGDGQYETGANVRINTSASTGFVFKYWLKDGVQYTTSKYFYYTVGSADANFEAVWEYDPSTPDEPQYSNQYRLYLQQSPEGCCSFNRNSGEKAEADTYITLTASPSQGFQFLGWYEDGVLVNSNEEFGYLMPAKNTTLTAKYEFNPVLPGEPSSDGTQTDVANGILGDLNGDGNLNITDVVVLVNCCLNDRDVSYSVADLNSDGSINITDVVALVNKCLNNN